MSETKQYTAENILVHPGTWSDDPGLVLAVTPEDAGRDYISFQVRNGWMRSESWSFASGENELAIVNLRGVTR
ncbi:MAG: hypothetical protein R2838_11330 [Caldilineaceae bacterium]